MIVREMFKEPFAEDEVGTVAYGKGSTHFIKKVLDRNIWWDKRSSTLDPFLNTIRKHLQPDVLSISPTKDCVKMRGSLFCTENWLRQISILYQILMIDPVKFPSPSKSREKLEIGILIPAGSPGCSFTRVLTQARRCRFPWHPMNLSFWFLNLVLANHVTRTDLPKILDLNESALIAEADKNGTNRTTLSVSDHNITRTSIVSGIPSAFEVGGSWHLQLKGKDFPGLDTTFTEPFSWTDVPGSRHCSGTGQYEIDFYLPEIYKDRDMILRLELGKVANIADVFVNGKKVGVVWMRGQNLNITEFVQSGANKLTVRVINTNINRVAGFKNNSPIPADLVSRFGAKDINEIPMEFGFEPLPPSGLMGPVRIVPGKKVSIAITQ